MNLFASFCCTIISEGEEKHNRICEKRKHMANQHFPCLNCLNFMSEGAANRSAREGEQEMLETFHQKQQKSKTEKRSKSQLQTFAVGITFFIRNN